MEQSKPIDPRVQEGLSRIEYLDCMLKAKMQKEKQVKRQGRDLRRQLHMQLMNAIRTPETTTRTNSAQTLPSQHSLTDLAMVCACGSIDLVQPRQEIMQNIERFFASDYDQPHGRSQEECIDLKETSGNVPDLCSGLLTDAESLGSHTKVFSTECNLDEKEPKRKSGIHLEQENSTIPERSSGDDAYNPGDTDDCPTTPTWTRNDKDYVQRNIELAAKASELLPRTADEEDRLEELLADTDESDNSPFELLALTSGLWSVGNDHRAKIDCTQGYILQNEDIAQKQSKLNRPGEAVLSGTQQTREDLQRLNEINQRLETIQQDNFQQLKIICFILLCTYWWKHDTMERPSV